MTSRAAIKSKGTRKRADVAQRTKRKGFNGMPPPRLAFNIPELCEAARISEGFYFKLKREGRGPREMKMGARTLVSVDAAKRWLRAFERETATATAEAAE
jgi:hypothetical protein